MDTSDDVAIVALVVSLIALAIACIQLLQQLFGTADGYRRCDSSVMGIWSKTRRSPFVARELRYETTYVTPQIALFSPRDFQDAENEFENGIYWLSRSKLQEPCCKLIKETVHPFHARSSKQTNHQSPVQEELDGQDRRSGQDLEKTPKGWLASDQNRRKPKKRGAQTDLLVTWLLLLQELHSVYSSYWPGECAMCRLRSNPMDSIPDRKPAHIQKEASSVKDKELDNFARRDPAIIYRRWNWDFMPPEMVRPLAESTLGDIVILALRMGMQWRILEPENSKLQADGNGYIMSATDVKGLGMVLRLTAAGSSEEFPKLIPSVASDKLACGIISRCPDFVDQDFALVSNDRKCLNIDIDDGLLSRIGVSE